MDNPNNQDRITDSTWITRDNQHGIFNAFSEQNYEFNGGDDIHTAPSNTLWAYGNTDEVSEEEYKPFKSAVQDIISLQDLPGNTFSLFLVSDNLYFDVEYLSRIKNIETIIRRQTARIDAVFTSSIEYQDLKIPLVNVLTPKYFTAPYSLSTSMTIKKSPENIDTLDIGIIILKKV